MSYREGALVARHCRIPLVAWAAAVRGIERVAALACDQVFADGIAIPGTPAAGAGVITLAALLMAGLSAGLLRRR